MRRKTVRTLALLLLTALVPPAEAALERAGPVDPAHGYPAWYQDRSGLVLELCNLRNADELAHRWCGLVSPLPPEPPRAAPETFPDAFSSEHFYWSGYASFGVAGDAHNRASLILGVHAGFASDVVIPGDQLTFGRLRIVVKSLPMDGTYHVYTPYGVYDFPDQKAGARLFFTEDIGARCPSGSFDCALATNVGPFLLPSATPGGAELPPIPLLKAGTASRPGLDPYHDALALGEAGLTPYPGDPSTQRPKYIADPARLGPVTGSPLPPFATRIAGPLDDCKVQPAPKRLNCGRRNHNIFRIEVEPADGSRPQVIGETYNFALTGRIHEGTIAGKVTVERATYQVPVWSSATAGQLDIFARAFPALQGRLPAGPKPQAIAPALHFFDDPCLKDPVTGKPIGPPPPEHGEETPHTHQMFADGSRYWGQVPPCGPSLEVPSEVCVVQRNAVDAAGKPVAVYYSVPVTDEVSVASVSYDPEHRTVKVSASSSDLLQSPTLTASGIGDLAAGQPSGTRLAAPSKVRVVSSKGGMDEREVSTGPAITRGPVAPIAANDMVRTREDTAVPVINVLANDTVGGKAVIPAGAVVSIVAKPRLGVAVVNPDNTIRYTPGANRAGSDGFAYKVKVRGVTSNVAGVSVLVDRVNDVPVATNDAAVTLQGYPVQIDVLANDVDADGAGDMVEAVNVTVPAGATVKAAGRRVSFVAPAAGTYTFTYQAQDSTGARSTPATVLVAVHAVEVISVAPPALFRTDQGRWTISGSDAPVANQTLTIAYADGPNAGFVLGSAIVDALGNWAFDAAGASGVLNPAVAGATQVVVAGPTGGRAVAPISLRP